jgi:hypothetical protein
MDFPSLMPLDNADMVIIGCKYGRLANNCTSNGRLAILVGKFQKLIFICYCTVLLAVGNSKTTVNWMMRQYISDSDHKNLERHHAPIYQPNVITAEESTRQMLRPAQTSRFPKTIEQISEKHPYKAGPYQAPQALLCQSQVK